jgi:lipopolysaccharide/colanic/teichoic acid biosynthesis glycosyltransferase
MFLKRAFDAVVSGCALVLLCPFLVFVALAVLVDSGWPVFFPQERVGRRFRPFRIWKFRTMVARADGPPVTVLGDTRITRVGRVLRAWKLDELPQLWNVLCGDMSLVGPRPELPMYVEMFRVRFAPVLELRPGMTDSASIAYRSEERMLSAAADPLAEYTKSILPAKLALAEEYVRTRSFTGDLAILVRTLWVIATPRGRGR